MTDLSELIARVEAAKGPDRALDVAIAVAVDWRWPDWEEGEVTARGQAERHGLDWLVGRVTEGWSSMWRHMPAFTISLDAATALASEGQIRHIEWLAEGVEAVVFVDDTADCVTGTGAIPALAMTAAALRARDAIADRNPKGGDAVAAPCVA